jgi:hypothetical protein
MQKARTVISLNRTTLLIFAPVLILAGIAGFIVPAEKSFTSGAAAYNVFHILFGVIGLVMVLWRSEKLASLFNLEFGLIDLYQALASYLHLPPETYFRWTKYDDILHVIIGLALVTIGTYGILKSKELQR